MQLSSIELLYVSAQPLHKVRLQSENLEKVMHSMLALLTGRRVSLEEDSRRLSPKSSLLKSGVRTYTVFHA
jgi:nitrate/nitrite-specific signal transduction histidine kinase